MATWNLRRHSQTDGYDEIYLHTCLSHFNFNLQMQSKENIALTALAAVTHTFDIQRMK